MQLMFSFKRQRFSTSGFLVGLSRRWICSQRGRTVMSFGDGSHGALGLPMPIVGLGSDVYEPTPISGLPCDVTSIAAGHFHSIAVTREGHVYSWGRNTEAQLGRHHLSPREKWNEPKRVEGLDKVRVRSAFASGVVSAALAEDGSLWVWGTSKNGQLGLGEGLKKAVLPSRVETLAGEHIVKASFGWGHALAMSASGKLFGWGYYADGRIGKMGKELEISPLEEYKSPRLRSPEKTFISAEEAAEQSVFEAIEKEKDMPVIWKPGLVEELLGVTVEDIACGLDHSLVVCSDGTLLSGGSNAYGQLGRTSQDLGLHPVDIGGFRASSVASGLGHSLAVCEDPSSGPKVFSWGWNQSCQLGRQCPAAALGHIPLQVEGLEGGTPKLVSAGRAHSLVVTTKNEVWAWGCGKNGRLGLCSSADEAEPMLVDFCQDFELLEAVAGLDHTLVLGEIVC
ncbi:unnamed protein product [Cuscuta campestris]|uniref:RCC1-like domain-containing protein n=1 Tax=Cuscuta campestris TaxID=132261 RepID=A0A484MFL9_9ASTE|nr:unnamed protein product [Cuscuta campestris]